MKTEYAVIHEPNGDQTRLIGELTHRREIADEIALNTFLRLGGRVYVAKTIAAVEMLGDCRYPNGPDAYEVRDFSEVRP